MKAAIAGIDEAVIKAGLEKEPEYFMVKLLKIGSAKGFIVVCSGKRE